MTTRALALVLIGHQCLSANSPVRTRRKKGSVRAITGHQCLSANSPVRTMEDKEDLTIIRVNGHQCLSANSPVRTFFSGILIKYSSDGESPMPFG